MSTDFGDCPVLDEVSNGQIKKCPHLSEINRKALDFDMDRVCSTTLSNQNVYCCLVCGKFFCGRSRGTPAHTHSVQCGHFVFVNLHTTGIFCLPDDYEVFDSSLDDIKYCLQPTFDGPQLTGLDRNVTLSRDVSGTAYLPGYVGMNNLNRTDYINTALHILAHIRPVRDFFLQPSNYASCRCVVVHKFGEVMRKLWSRGNFKSIVSPHGFVHSISVASKGRFKVGCQAQVVEFFSWLLNTLHDGLVSSVVATAASNKKRARGQYDRSHEGKSSIIYDSFQGLIEVETIRQISGSEEQQTIKTSSSQEIGYLFLTLNIPPIPLFKGTTNGTDQTPSIPEVPLYELLKKMDGQTWTDTPSPTGLVKRRYVLKKLPNYLVLNLERFTKTQFGTEKNPTIVPFPVRNLDMKEYLNDADSNNDTTCTDSDKPVGHEELADMSMAKLKDMIQKSESIEAKHMAAKALERCDVEAAAKLVLDAKSDVWKYDLVASICHDSSTHRAVASKVSTSDERGRGASSGGRGDGSTGGGPGGSAASGDGRTVVDTGSYKTHVHHKATGQWFELQDLHVTEIMQQLVGVSESNILVYVRKGLH